MQLFFSDLKNIKWFQKLTVHGGIYYFVKFYFIYSQNWQATKIIWNILRILYVHSSEMLKINQ
jgi:hypothetical protein